MITAEIASSLSHGQILHHVTEKNADGTPMRVRVSGKCQRWKKEPERFKLPVKYGLYQSGYIENWNCSQWNVANK